MHGYSVCNYTECLNSWKDLCSLNMALIENSFENGKHRPMIFGVSVENRWVGDVNDTGRHKHTINYKHHIADCSILVRITYDQKTR